MEIIDGASEDASWTMSPDSSDVDSDESSESDSSLTSASIGCLGAYACVEQVLFKSTAEVYFCRKNGTYHWEVLRYG